jgi:hypothetical protein
MQIRNARMLICHSHCDKLCFPAVKGRYSLRVTPKKTTSDKGSPMRKLIAFALVLALVCQLSLVANYADTRLALRRV